MQAWIQNPSEGIPKNPPYGRACSIVLACCSATSFCAFLHASAVVVKSLHKQLIAIHQDTIYRILTDAKRRTRDWPELRSKDIVPRVIFNDGWIQNGFKDVSWSAWMQPLDQTKQKGMLGGPGMCASVQGGGAFALKAWNGIFQNTVALEFWTYVGEIGDYGEWANIPDIEVSISGDKASVDSPLGFKMLMLSCAARRPH
eukprot:1160628-Pelagomonas_calceolata.AAC.3